MKAKATISNLYVRQKTRLINYFLKQQGINIHVYLYLCTCKPLRLIFWLSGDACYFAGMQGAVLPHFYYILWQPVGLKDEFFYIFGNPLATQQIINPCKYLIYRGLQIIYSTQSRYITEKIRENKTILKDYKSSS